MIMRSPFDADIWRDTPKSDCRGVLDPRHAAIDTVDIEIRREVVTEIAFVAFTGNWRLS